MTIAIVLTLQEDQCDAITFVDYHFNTIVILLSETFMKIYNMVRLFNTYAGSPLVRESQGNLFFLQGQGKVREFCKMVREIWKSSKVREF